MATMKNKVIWQEGLFALPQHFQQQQRHCEYLLTRRLDALGDFFWGFTELSINTELLAQGKIMIDRAAGCMPDGTVFSIPDQDLLPEPFQPGTLSSKESHNIYLALPVISDVINEIQGCTAPVRVRSVTASPIPASVIFTLTKATNSQSVWGS